MRLKDLTNKGVTLIELLVVIALLSILVGVGTETVLSLIKSNAKTETINEAKQNGQIVMDTFEKDARTAKSVSPLGSTKTITLAMPDDSTITYSCVNGGSSNNDYLSRMGVSLTTRDVNNGVNIAYVNCSFSVVSTVGNRKIVNFNFILTEPKNRVVTSGGRPEYKVEIPFSTTITLRNF